MCVLVLVCECLSWSRNEPHRGRHHIPLSTQADPARAPASGGASAISPASPRIGARELRGLHAHAPHQFARASEEPAVSSAPRSRGGWKAREGGRRSRAQVSLLASPPLLASHLLHRSRRRSASPTITAPTPLPVQPDRCCRTLQLSLCSRRLHANTSRKLSRVQKWWAG